MTVRERLVPQGPPGIAFDRPTLIKSAAAPRFLWGDRDAGYVSDWIYGSSPHIHMMSFEMNVGARFGNSPDFKTYYNCAETYHCLKGEFTFHCPETGEVHVLNKGDTLYFPPKTWHWGYNFGSETCRVLECLTPRTEAAVEAHARKQPWLKDIRYAQRDLIGRFIPGRPRPTSWKDALKEEYKGKVAMVDDATGLIGTWAPIVTGTKTPTRITMDELTKTIDFLIDVKKNHARTFSASYGEAVDLFARGEVVTSVIGWDAMVGFAAAKNKKLDYVIPEEGVFVFLDTLAIPKGAPNLDLAYKMLEQCISAAGQKHIADTLTQAIITKAAVPLVDAKNRDIYQYDNLPALFEKAHFYPFWPLEPEGDFVTHEQSQEEYQRLLKA